MTDQPAPTPPAAPAEATPPAAAPKPAPKLIRWKGLIAFAVFLLLFAVALPWVVESWALGLVRTRLLANGWELTPDSQLSINLYRANITGGPLALRMAKPDASGKQEQVLQMDRLHAGLALLESFNSWDLVIDELAVVGASGTLRRGPDGRPPVAPEPDTTGSTGGGIDWAKMDWKGYYEQGMERLKKWQEEKKAAEEQAKQEPKPDAPKKTLPPEQDTDFNQDPVAKRYLPTPRGDRHIPRVVVRRLTVSGKAIQLPDQSAFDVQSFALGGTNLSLRQDLGETMTLTGAFVTGGAGTVNLDWARTPDDAGTFHLTAPAVPLEALSQPSIAGGDSPIAKYGVKGTAKLDVPLRWTGWDLNGTVGAMISGLEVHPQNGDAQAKQVALVVDKLKGKDLPWTATVGGTLLAPKLTDTGATAFLDQVKGAVVDAAKEEAARRAKEEAAKQLQKQLEKNPEAQKAKEQLENDPNVKKATEGLKGLFGK